MHDSESNHIDGFANQIYMTYWQVYLYLYLFIIVAIYKNHITIKKLSQPLYGACATPKTLTRKTHKHNTLVFWRNLILGKPRINFISTKMRALSHTNTLVFVNKILILTFASDKYHINKKVGIQLYWIYSKRRTTPQSPYYCQFFPGNASKQA